MKALLEYLPWAGLAVGLAGLLIRDKGDEKGVGALGVLFAPAVGVAAAIIGAQFLSGDLRIALTFLAAGVVVSSLIGIAAARFGQSATGALVTGLGVASFALGNDIEAIAVSSHVRLGGLVIGLGVGCLPFVAAKRGRAVVLTTLFVFVAGVAAMISRIGYRAEIADAPVLALWCALLAVAVFWAGGRALGEKVSWAVPALSVVALAGLGWLALSTYLGEGDLGVCAVSAVVAALVTAWAVKPDMHSVLSWGVAALIWLGLATFAFSNGFGLGMGVAAMFGVAALLVTKRADLLPAAWIVVGLSLYRLFREHNGELVQAFDIGQHYAMIGFLVGVVVLVAAVDALMRHRGPGPRAYVVALMATVVVLGATAFFGTKGAIGIMVGLAIAPMVVRLVPNATHWSVIGSAVLQCAVMVAYRPIAWEMELDQPQKVKLLVWLGAGLAVLWLAVWLLDRKREEKVVANA
jgi:hypothetical protein